MSWVFFGQVFSVGLGFVILKLLSGLGPENYGIYTLVLTIAAFKYSNFQDLNLKVI